MPVNGGSRNPKQAGHMCRFHPLDVEQSANLGTIYANFSTFVGPPALCRFDTLDLAFTSEISFELGKYAQHVQKCFTSGGGSVDRLLRCTKRDAALLEVVNNVLQVLH